jgi:hypothetical protein
MSGFAIDKFRQLLSKWAKADRAQSVACIGIEEKATLDFSGMRKYLCTKLSESSNYIIL